MTIDEAIKVLEGSLLTTVPDFDVDEQEAMKLGIEALRTVKRAREFNWNRWPGLLEGETKE